MNVRSSIPFCGVDEFEKFYLPPGSAPLSPAPSPHEGLAPVPYFGIFLRTENPCKNEIDINRSEFHKILLITKGEGVLCYGTETYDVRSPSLLLLRPVDVRSWKATTRAQEGFYCVFNEAFLAYDSIRGSEIRTSPPTKTSPLLPLSEDELPLIEASFDSLYREYKSGRAYSLEISRMFLEIILMQSRRLAHLSQSRSSSPAAAKLTERFVDLLEKEVAGIQRAGTCSRSPADFATKLGVHPNYLNACVKRVTGRAVHSFIQDRLLLEARVMLQYTHLNISEIAYNLGFTEPTHFCNFFKKASALTPTQFRKLRTGSAA